MPVANYRWDDLTDNIHQETDTDGKIEVQYTQTPKLYGHVISQRRGTTKSFYHFDGFGSTRVLTNINQITQNTYEYSAFGQTVAETGGFVNAFRWMGSTGYYFDSSPNNYYVRRRYYDSLLAKWLSLDPQLFSDGANNYAYVRNRPTWSIDPSGQASMKSSRTLESLGAWLFQAMPKGDGDYTTMSRPSSCGACCPEDIDVLMEGTFKGGFDIYTYFPKLQDAEGAKANWTNHKDPSKLGFFRNNHSAIAPPPWIGLQVQVVTTVEGPGELCNFTQFVWIEKAKLGGVELPEHGEIIDDIKNSGYDQSKPPFRQYIDGNPSIADPPGGKWLRTLENENYFVTCIFAGGERALSCPNWVCCIDWWWTVEVGDRADDVKLDKGKGEMFCV